MLPSLPRLLLLLEFLLSSIRGKALRVTLLTASGGVVHLFVVYGYQGAGENSVKLLLTDKLLRAVLAESQVICVGQPLLIAGDLNANPCVIPCLAKGISAGKFVDLALACSLRGGGKPDPTCRFKLDFMVACANALAASTVCTITDRWFTPHFSVYAGFNIGRWAAEFLVFFSCQPLGLARWIVSPERSSGSVTRSVQDPWHVYWEELAVVLPDTVDALRGAHDRSSVDEFWSVWSVGAEARLFQAYSTAGGPRICW